MFYPKSQRTHISLLGQPNEFVSNELLIFLCNIDVKEEFPIWDTPLSEAEVLT